MLGATLERSVRLLDLSSCGVALCYVALLARPLVFAALSGVHIIGVELPAVPARPSAMRLAAEWAGCVSASLATTAFLVGEYVGGPRLAVVPLRTLPQGAQVVRTPADRRRLSRAGVLFAWCAMAALATCVVADPAARAIAAV